MAGLRPSGPQVGIGAHQHKVALGQVDSRGAESAAIDRAAGVHLLKVLGDQTLAANAANPKHLAKMAEAAEIIGTIDRMPGNLNSVATFRPKQAFALYEHCFPNPDEREPVADIRARLKEYPNGAHEDGGGFHALAITDKKGSVIGYTQGSTVPSEAGLFYYWQYGCVADGDYMKSAYAKDANPREHGVMSTIHGVNAATLNATADQVQKPALGIVWESEPRGLGDDPSSIQFTDTRLQIHNRAGGRIMMGVAADGELINLHLQPRLTADSEPIALHMMYRPLQYEEGEERQRGEMKKADAESMMLAWLNNFRVEGFAEKDVKEAEGEVQARLARCEKIVLLPADQVPDVVTLAATDKILEQQVLDMYGVGSLAEARAFYQQAMQG
ncbi:MAG: hypothetical protein KC933_11835 [Myxococcales bacterium]|nr:hypothetical protein [Myxococcales bacterium]MCB9649011.1 hypothetical protein [Deltaproteobacteria bacterium]